MDQACLRRICRHIHQKIHGRIKAGITTDKAASLIAKNITAANLIILNNRIYVIVANNTTNIMMTFYIANSRELITLFDNTSNCIVCIDFSFCIPDNAVIITGNTSGIITGIELFKKLFCIDIFYITVATINIAGIISRNTTGIFIHGNNNAFIDPVINLYLQISLWIRKKQAFQFFRVLATIRTDIILIWIHVSGIGIASRNTSGILICNNMIVVFSFSGIICACNHTGRSDIKTNNTADIAISKKAAFFALLYTCPTVFNLSVIIISDNTTDINALQFFIEFVFIGYNG